MQLEQTLETYQPRVSEQRQQTYFVVEDLENLSANVLYSESRRIIRRGGTTETVLKKFIDNDTVKVYINPLTGKVDASYQNGGEKHREYSGSGRMVNNISG